MGDFSNLIRSTWRTLKREQRLLYFPVIIFFVILAVILTIVAIAGPFAPFIYPLL